MEQKRQFSVFIVDDEMYIVEMLKSLIDWQEQCLSLCGVAYDGLLAYEKILKMQPDIVIVDIRLPGLNGLELISKCTERHVPSKFIIISGYGQFEYAQTAMQYGVREYILKPIKREDIVRALQNTRKILEGSQEKVESESAIDEVHVQRRGVLRDHFVTELLEGKAFDSSIEGLNERYMLSLTPGRFQVLIFNLDCDASIPEEEHAQIDEHVQGEILSQIVEPLKPYCSDVITKSQRLRLVALLNFTRTNERLIANEISCRLNYVQSAVKQWGKTRITLAKGLLTSDLGFIFKSYESAREALLQRILHPSESIFNAEDWNMRSGEPVAISLADIHLIQSAVKNGNAAMLEDSLNAIFSAYCTPDVDDADVYWAIAQQIFSVFVNARNTIAPINHMEREMELRCILSHCGTEEQFRAAFVEYLIDQMRLNASNASGSVICKIDKYIAENYMHKITLRELADVVYLNPVYLSVYFKKNKGVNMIDYINDFRVEKAKELLRSTDDPIYLISEKVGFTSAKYFTKVFRKTVGASPSEYRKG